jgi:hypothetical protein
VVHIALTGQNYQLVSAEALWFAGTGVMLIAAGLLTYCASIPGARSARVCSLIINVLGFSQAIMAVPILQQPQVYVLIVFFLAALIGVSGLVLKAPALRI